MWVQLGSSWAWLAVGEDVDGDEYGHCLIADGTGQNDRREPSLALFVCRFGGATAETREGVAWPHWPQEAKGPEGGGLAGVSFRKVHWYWDAVLHRFRMGRGHVDLATGRGQGVEGTCIDSGRDVRMNRRYPFKVADADPQLFAALRHLPQRPLECACQYAVDRLV